LASVTQIIQRRRRRAQRQRSRQARTRLGLGILGLLLLLFVVLPAVAYASGAALMYWRATRNLPEPQATIYLDPIVGPTRLYDRSGQTLLFSVQDPLGDERAWTRLDSLPAFVSEATLIAEDPDFLTRSRPGLVSSMLK